VPLYFLLRTLLDLLLCIIFGEFPKVNKHQIAPHVASPIIQFIALYFTLDKLTAHEYVNGATGMYMAYIWGNGRLIGLVTSYVETAF
jgi:hypothetical protein